MARETVCAAAVAFTIPVLTPERKGAKPLDTDPPQCPYCGQLLVERLAGATPAGAPAPQGAPHRRRPRLRGVGGDDQRPHESLDRREQPVWNARRVAVTMPCRPDAVAVPGDGHGVAG